MGPRMREELLAFVSERGTLLEPDAVEFLLVQRDPIAELDGFLRSCPETPFVVTLDDIRQTKNGHRIIEIEDELERIAVLLPAESAVAQEPVVSDEVLGVVGTVNAKGLVIAASLVRPDLPTAKPFPGTPGHARVAFMSDIHVGSRTFLDEKWSKVSDWLGGADEVARSIRYLVVSGDVGDGIGVYPRQDEELTIDDIYGQYEALARMIRALPDRLALVKVPGKHHPVRATQPAT